MMLRKQIENLLATFREEGGFSEGLTAERLAYRTEQSVQSNAPACPKCGKTNDQTCCKERCKCR